MKPPYKEYEIREAKLVESLLEFKCGRQKRRERRAKARAIA